MMKMFLWLVLMISVFSMSLVSANTCGDMYMAVGQSKFRDVFTDLNDTGIVNFACDEIARDIARGNITRALYETDGMNYIKAEMDEWFLEDTLELPNSEECKIGYYHELSCNDRMVKDDFKERFNGLCEKSLDAINEINKDRLIGVPELYKCSATAGSIAMVAILCILGFLAAVGLIIVIIALLCRARKTKGKGKKNGKNYEEETFSLDAESSPAVDEEAPAALNKEELASEAEEAPAATDVDTPADSTSMPTSDEEAGKRN